MVSRNERFSQSLVPSEGASTGEFMGTTARSVLGVVSSSGKGERSISVSWKQPSYAIACEASLDTGNCYKRDSIRYNVDISFMCCELTSKEKIHVVTLYSVLRKKRILISLSMFIQ